MASNITRDHHTLRRNLKLNDNYISNDGQNEGVSIDDAGVVTMSSQLDIGDMSLTSSELDVSTGSFTLDVDGGITLDANSGEIVLTNLQQGASAEHVTIDKNSTVASTATSVGLLIDYDDTGGTSFLNTTTNIGLDIDLNSNSPTKYGTCKNYGIDIDMVAGTSGTQTSTGIDISVTGADANYGIKVLSSHEQLALYYDGTSNASFTVADDSHLTIATAETGNITLDAAGHVEFDGCGVGFDLETPTYNASDTDVNFINGNKQFVTFDGGDIADLNLIFPKVSGNFLLMLKQDGTGGRTVTNYKVWDRVDSSAASGSATVKFAGGSNPDLTDDANHVDIVSFFYDADNEIAYGVATLDFQF